MSFVVMLFTLYLSGFVIAHNKVGVGVGVGDQALRKSSSPSTGVRTRDTGDSSAR